MQNDPDASGWLMTLEACALVVQHTIARTRLSKHKLGLGSQSVRWNGGSREEKKEKRRECT